MPTFSIPLSGLTASSTALATIANNLANLNTVGYKDARVLFRDLFYQTIGNNGGATSNFNNSGMKKSRSPLLNSRFTPESLASLLARSLATDEKSTAVTW